MESYFSGWWIGSGYHGATLYQAKPMDGPSASDEVITMFGHYGSQIQIYHVSSWTLVDRQVYTCFGVKLKKRGDD